MAEHTNNEICVLHIFYGVLRSYPTLLNIKFLIEFIKPSRSNTKNNQKRRFIPPDLHSGTSVSLIHLSLIFILEVSKQIIEVSDNLFTWDFTLFSYSDVR